MRNHLRLTLEVHDAVSQGFRARLDVEGQPAWRIYGGFQSGVPQLIYFMENPINGWDLGVPLWIGNLQMAQMVIHDLDELWISWWFGGTWSDRKPPIEGETIYDKDPKFCETKKMVARIHIKQPQM